MVKYVVCLLVGLTLVLSPYALLVLLGIAWFHSFLVILGTYDAMSSKNLSWRTRIFVISPGVLGRTREILLSGLTAAVVPTLLSQSLVGLATILVALWSLLPLSKISSGTYTRMAWILLVLPTAALGMWAWLMALTESPEDGLLMAAFLGPIVFGSVFAGWQVMQINRRLGRGETLESMGLRTADSSVDEGEVRDDAHVQ